MVSNAQPKKILLVLGNGFTIDFLNFLDKSKHIDVTNLFRLGAQVPWPGSNEPGFLSFKYCPHLWNLGARCHISTRESIELIEDVLTCTNAFATRRYRGTETVPAGTRNNDIYLFACKELSIYLRHLFIWYDLQVQFNETDIINWPWAKYLLALRDNPLVGEVVIITYNYDLWLERVLKTLAIPFCLEPFERRTTKFSLLKPHGSISFCHRTKRDRISFAIPRDYDLLNGEIGDFQIRYDELDENYLVNPMIPPSGESARFSQLWAGAIRHTCIEYAGKLSEADELIICGHSYWPVDRAEMDEILNAVDPQTNVRLVNPDPSRTFVAVLTSIFQNLVAFTSSAVLRS